MRRWAGISGLAFIVLAFISAAVQGGVPDPEAGDATEQFARFYADEDNHSRALISALLGMVGQFFFLWFLGGRGARCGRRPVIPALRRWCS